MRLLVLLWGCAEESVQRDGEKKEPAVEGPEIDPFPQALGDCTATAEIIERDEEGEFRGSASYEWNSDGDLVRLEHTSPESGNRYVTTYAYGDTHERSVESREDGETRYTWSAGHIVRTVESYGDLPTSQKDDAYDERGLLLHSETDYDNDATMDSRLYYSWEEDGDGFRGDGEGEDADGPYEIESWADELGRIWRFVSDKGSYEIEWERSELNPLGYAASTTETLYDGESTWEFSDETTFDVLHRPVTYRYVLDTPDTHVDYDMVYHYSCP